MEHNETIELCGVCISPLCEYMPPTPKSDTSYVNVPRAYYWLVLCECVV